MITNVSIQFKDNLKVEVNLLDGSAICSKGIGAIEMQSFTYIKPTIKQRLRFLFKGGV